MLFPSKILSFYGQPVSGFFIVLMLTRNSISFGSELHCVWLVLRRTTCFHQNAAPYRLDHPAGAKQHVWKSLRENELWRGSYSKIPLALPWCAFGQHRSCFLHERFGEILHQERPARLHYGRQINAATKDPPSTRERSFVLLRWSWDCTVNTRSR